MQRKTFKMNSSLTVELVVRSEDEPEPQEVSDRHDAQLRVVEKMGWTWDEYFELVRMLMRRKDIYVEDLSPAERFEYFEIHYGLSQSFKKIIPPSQFGFLGGRTRKIPPERHPEVRQEVRQLLKQRIPKSEAYAIVASHWNNASPATVKRICEDHNAV